MIPSTPEILARLVAEPTVSRRSNLALLDYVESLLRPAGARIERFAHPDGSRANLFATIGPEEPDGVVLSGHTDVVPVEGQAWSRDPFTLAERDGRLYGRGTTDMKGFVAASLRAALLAAGRPLARPLHLAFSYDEEIGCIGVRGMIEALAARRERPALCIVGEPTEMRIATGHKGKRALRACCHGQEGHSALAPNALNALHLGAAFIGALQKRQEALATGGGEEGRPQAGRDETLHIRSAAAVKAAVMLAEREGIAAPSLSLDRHDIRMARQDHTARPRRADGCPEIGAAAVRMGEPLDARARRAQKPFHIVEQREVRAA